MKLMIKADAQRAIPELQRLKEANKDVDRSAKEAAQSQERLARGTSPGVSPTGGVYGVQGAVGQSKAGAHLASITPTPPPLPGRALATPPHLPGRTPSHSPTPESDFAGAFKATALV